MLGTETYRPPHFGDHHLSRVLRHPGDRAQDGDRRVKRDAPMGDLDRQIGNRSVDVVDDLATDDRVVISEVLRSFKDAGYEG